MTDEDELAEFARRLSATVMPQANEPDELEETERWIRRVKKRPAVRIAIAVAALLAVAGIVVAVVIFSHVVPPSSTGVLGSSCANGTLTLSTPLTPIGSSGTEVLTCGANPALTSQGGTPTTPTFTLGSGYTGLGIVGHGLSCSGSSPLASGTALTIASGSYDYCATYANVPAAGLGTFTITWSQ